MARRLAFVNQSDLNLNSLPSSPARRRLENTLQYKKMNLFKRRVKCQGEETNKTTESIEDEKAEGGTGWFKYQQLPVTEANYWMNNTCDTTPMGDERRW